jgi:hypothetical protein
MLITLSYAETVKNLQIILIINRNGQVSILV